LILANVVDLQRIEIEDEAVVLDVGLSDLADCFRERGLRGFAELQKIEVACRAIRSIETRSQEQRAFENKMLSVRNVISGRGTVRPRSERASA